MDLKSVLIGLLLGCCLLLLLGARQAPQPAPTMGAEVGRYQFLPQKTARGVEYWTIFDTAEGVAKVFKQGSVHVVSFPENVSEKLQ